MASAAIRPTLHFTRGQNGEVTLAVRQYSTTE